MRLQRKHRPNTLKETTKYFYDIAKKIPQQNFEDNMKIF
jgi:hypothetical protein